jgi:hypothetical protein
MLPTNVTTMCLKRYLLCNFCNTLQKVSGYAGAFFAGRAASCGANANRNNTTVYSKTNTIFMGGHASTAVTDHKPDTHMHCWALVSDDQMNYPYTRFYPIMSLGHDGLLTYNPDLKPSMARMFHFFLTAMFQTMEGKKFARIQPKYFHDNIGNSSLRALLIKTHLPSPSSPFGVVVLLQILDGVLSIIPCVFWHKAQFPMMVWLQFKRYADWKTESIRLFNGLKPSDPVWRGKLAHFKKRKVEHFGIKVKDTGHDWRQT